MLQYLRRKSLKSKRKALNQTSVGYVTHDNTEQYFMFRSLKNAANLEYLLFHIRFTIILSENVYQYRL